MTQATHTIAQLDVITDKIIVSCKEAGAHGKRQPASKRAHSHGRKQRRC